MNLLARAAVLLVLFHFPISLIGLAAADPIAIGSMPAGSPSYGMALAIAKAAKEGAGLDFLPKPFKSTGQAVPLVAKGELNFAFSNAAELVAAWNGTGVFKDHCAKSLRLVARLFPLRIAIGVRKDDPAQTLADLKGRTLPSGFATTTTGDQLLLALLSTAGLTYQDVKTVQVADFPTMRDAFVERRTDITMLIIGSGADQELARKVGGIRILELPQGDDVDAKIKAVFPVARTEMLDPKDSGSAADKPTRIMSYDFYLYAHEGAPAEVVKSLIASMIERHDTLAAAYPSFAWLNAKNIVGDIGLPYHAAAEQYYREHQLWPPGP
jgi:TRAP transporter TAXI family solute receptor